MPYRRALAPLLACLAVLLAAPAAQAGPPILPRSHSHEHVCGTPAPGHAHCHAEVITDATAQPFVAAGPNGYGPADLRSAYGVVAAAAARGAGQTVAIVDAYDDPTAAADLATYRSTFGLPACSAASGCFRKVNQSGGTKMPAVDASWAQEISLDLDMVSAICPNCHILLVEANSDSMADLGAAVDQAATLGATQISNSYGGSEFRGETSYESHYDHPGIAVTASSGDDGYGAEYPAASRYVTAVGGTSLKPSAGSARGWAETAWGSAGSGCSAYVQKPAFQTDSGCSRRTVADVAAVADPNTGVAIYDSTPYQTSSGWMVFGGTSAAAPIVAAFDALVGPNAAPVAFPYDHAALFNDVTSGSNGSCRQSYLCTAAVGYDGPTGLGSPSGALIGGPAASTAGATGVTGRAATVGGTVNPEGQTTTYAFQYGTSAAYGSQAPAAAQDAGAGTSDVAVSADVAGLSPGTTYHYRLMAQNGSGTAYGVDQTFTTGAAPVAATGAAGEIGTDGASLAGSVTPDGLPTTYRFEYGTTTGYGDQSAEADAGSGTTPVDAATTLSGLAAATTYHYRLVATNAEGATAGADATFTTAAVPSAGLAATQDATNTSSATTSASAPAGAAAPTDTTSTSGAGVPAPTDTTSTSAAPPAAGTGLGLDPGLGLVSAAPLVRRVRLAKRTSSGRYDVRHGLRLSLACGAPCTVVARLSTTGGRSVVVGSARIRRARAGTRRLVVRLTRHGRTLLARRRLARLTLRLVVTDAAGHRVTVRRSFRPTR